MFLCLLFTGAKNQNPCHSKLYVHCTICYLAFLRLSSALSITLSIDWQNYTTVSIICSPLFKIYYFFFFIQDYITSESLWIFCFNCYKRNKSILVILNHACYMRRNVCLYYHSTCDVPYNLNLVAIQLTVILWLLESWFYLMCEKLYVVQILF